MTGPQKTATLPDAKQLELVREAAEQRRADAQARMLQKRDSASKCTGANLSRLSKLTRRSSHSHSALAATPSSHAAAASIFSSPYGSASSTPKQSIADSSSLARMSREGSWSGFIGNGFPGLSLVKGVFRPSDPGEVFSPRSVRINMDGPLDFVPITLVFQDLRYDNHLVHSSLGSPLLVHPATCPVESLT